MFEIGSYKFNKVAVHFVGKLLAHTLVHSAKKSRKKQNDSKCLPVKRKCVNKVYFMYQSNRSFNIPPSPPGIPQAFDAFSCPGGREFFHPSQGVRNLIAILHEKPWRRRRRCQTLMNSKEKIAYLWRIGWKPKVYTSCALYLKVFKNNLCL